MSTVFSSGDGAAPTVRRLGRGDLPEVERHLLALGPADRRKRFLLPADDGAIVGYVARLDPERAVVVGATDAEGRLVGVSEASPAADAPRTVEVAVTVHPYHRREGIGRRLAAGAVSLAFAEGAETAVSLFAPENRAAARLAAALGARSARLDSAMLVEATLAARDENGAAPRSGLAAAA